MNLQDSGGIPKFQSEMNNALSRSQELPAVRWLRVSMAECVWLGKPRCEGLGSVVGG